MPDLPTLKDLIEERQDRLKQIMTEPLVLGIDWGAAEHTAAVLAMTDGKSITIIDEATYLHPRQMEDFIKYYGHNELSGKRPNYVLIDEIPPMLGEDLVPLFDEPPLIKKNGKMVRRHHPVPTTPRRFRK